MSMAKKTAQPNFEQAMVRLEEIVEILDGGTLSLEQSLSLFSEGAGLIEVCNESLENASLTIEQMFPKP